MALPSDWYFGGAPRLRDVYGGFNVGDIQPQPQAPTTAATPPAPSARVALSPAGGFQNTFADGQVPDGNMPGGSFGGAPTGPAAPGGPGPIGNTAEAFAANPGMSPIDATQAAQAQNQADINATNSLALAGPIGTLGASLFGNPGRLAGSAASLLGLPTGGPQAAAAFAVPAAVMQGLGLFGMGPIGGNKMLAGDQNDLNAAFPTINPFEPQASEGPVAPSGNAFDAATGTPGTSGVNSAGQSVGFGAPGTAGAGVAGGFSSSFGGSGAGGAVGGSNFGGVGNNTATMASGIEGEGSSGGGAPGAPGPAGAGPGGAGEAGDSGGGSSGEGGPAGDGGAGSGDGGAGSGDGGEKRGGLIGKRPFGQRPDPKMLAAKLKTGGGTVTKGSKKPGADDVPVRLSKGEFVLPTGAVDLYGPLLEKMRQAGLHNSPGGFRVFH